MVTNRIIFFATSVQPNPEEIDYWVDLSDNPHGGSIKYFNGTEWVRLAASGGTPDLSNYYTKTQVNKLLNDKANVSDVDSKVDDEEVKDVIKDIQFNTSNPNNITMVMFKYDGSNDSISLPIASTGSAGIVTSKDFLDFVKQHQLQELHTKMIDTFADIRAKYQKKLIAGLNIKIDQETNVISASGDLATQWDNITGKPDFKPVATSGDYNDLINKLKPGKDVSISEDNVISIAIDSDSLEQSLATLNSNITQLQTQKVDKVEGKGLSTNDYTTPEKNKLAAIEAEANKYVLPAATASALGGVKIGSNITLADGGTISITKANVTSALGVDPTTTYVKKAGDTMTGTLTSASTTGSIVFKGVENSDITNIYKSGGNLSEGFGMHANADIINGLRFNWYDTFWYIGNIRGSGTESYGFGIVDNNDQMGFRVTTDAVYANKYTSSVSTGNAPISVKSTTMCPNLNADMVDGKNASDFQPSLYKTLKFTTNTSNSKVVWCDLCRIAQGYQNYSILVQISALQSAILCSVVVGYRGVSINILNSIIVSNYQFNQVYPTLRVVNRDNQSWLQCTFQQGITDQNNGNNLMSVNITTSDNKITLVDSLQEDTTKYTNAQIYGYASVSNNFGASMNIGSGEVVDWYGVRWSETSSNPDCTRIGNMEMHRTLPIQSMMKGYKVTTKQGNLPYMLRKLEDDWSKTIGGYYGGTYDNNFNGADTNIMVLIPEFWWIDDYSPSSKTHNLKICPHAKPGWNHHKEAFVGAYEGILTNDSFYSRKGVVPSVNVTREKLRTAARNNGNANEYKWNIYTYNEHRAICHLFLVEYATRNSQKAVNTELTPEGFRQGGLGSGCTTGTVTINGAQTWSFIPTGSSDSLGSGSGEVTVTIQQTDQSGSNTSTITRKCNRYRGIENPFGHIWKHTDDIISKYSIVSGKGYRSWSICENPINFSTNLTTKYTPICIEPVGTGYKTEIVITSTCDFFAHACANGSESTYWCDYNWDNTDTSEHCLLTGGNSDNGGWAGLFFLSSYDGVGHSGAHIGSRLTYLPWAE